MTTADPRRQRRSRSTPRGSSTHPDQWTEEIAAEIARETGSTS